MPHDTDSLAGWDRLVSRARSLADDLDRRQEQGRVKRLALGAAFTASAIATFVLPILVEASR